MQETWKFEISKGNNNEDPERLIQKILKQKQKEMGFFLSYYFKSEGAVVENVEFIDHLQFSDSRKGKFKVEFDLIHHNACLNIHDQKKDKLDIVFEIDQDKLQLIGPYWPERGQDEI